jgi:hypothetical protein
VISPWKYNIVGYGYKLFIVLVFFLVFFAVKKVVLCKRQANE